MLGQVLLGLAPYSPSKGWPEDQERKRKPSRCLPTWKELSSPFASAAKKVCGAVSEWNAGPTCQLGQFAVGKTENNCALT